MNGFTDRIIKLIGEAKSILVCGHIRPDGDCVGSALAVRRLCEKLGKPADAVCDGGKPDSYAFLPDYGNFCVPDQKSYDLFIAVDCATVKRLGDYAAYLKNAAHTINIDHHPTNENYGELNIIDGSACSTCALLVEIFDGTGLIDKDIATMLYTGISTDTGHFMHSNTDAKVFALAQKLCETGIDIGAVNRALYCSDKFSRVLLSARVTGGIRLYENGKIALMSIMQDDLNACGCTGEDTEGLIDNASGIRGVEIAIAMCEQPGNVYRVSFRAARADVSAAAAVFGGGGHKLAAGCIIVGNRYDVEEKLLAAAKEQLNKLQ